MIPEALKPLFHAGIFNVAIGAVNSTVLYAKIIDNMEYSWLTIANAMIPFMFALVVFYVVKRKSHQLTWDRLKNVGRDTFNEERL